jgi:hypothetical protein
MIFSQEDNAAKYKLLPLAGCQHGIRFDIVWVYFYCSCRGQSRIVNLVLFVLRNRKINQCRNTLLRQL